MSKYGGSSNHCMRCQKAVYFVEQQTCSTGIYHKSCFSCKECSKRLDSTNLADKDSEIYCKNCYGRLFGPKGYGYGNTLSTESKTSSVGNLANQLSGSNSNLKKSTDSLKEEPKLMDMQKYVGSNTCPRCDKQVYFAEQALGPGGIKYHKTCFKCLECKKTVDSTTMADKDLVMFCKNCHTKKFGTKGYGYGGAIAL